MKKLYSIILLLSVSFLGFGQPLDELMQSIEQNNPRLKAMQKWLEAEEVKVKTGIYPENPEISFYHLWGSPEAIGNQKELEITQSFRLPGFYTSKSAVQKLDFQQKQALAEIEKREVLLGARTVWFNLVWLHKKEALLKTRNEDSERLVSIMEQGFEGGEVSKPAFDKARIYAMGIQTERQKVQSEIEVQMHYIFQLNGDNSIKGLTYEYPFSWELPELNALLENLEENHPALVMAELGISKYESTVKYQKMNSLPSFQAGYKSETILNQKLQGFHAGISIPLWQNSNGVKHANLQTEWAAANLSQQKSEMKMQVSGLYTEIVALKKNYDQMKQIIEEETVSVSSLELLNSGQISFTDYLVDTQLIWETQNQFLQIENAYYELLSKLKTFE